MLSVENVSYDLMLISLAKQLGAEVAVEFAEFVVASGDHFAIQKKYEEILKNHLTKHINLCYNIYVIKRKDLIIWHLTSTLKKR